MITVHGAGPSPFVRKVRVALAEKSLAYTLDPLMPFGASPELKKVSPLGKIPAMTDGDATLADSSVICAYLERKYPEPALYPKDPYAYGRALWFEEYADSGLVAVIGPKIFLQKIVNPLFFNKPCDEAAVQKAFDEELPPLLDYLEGQLDAAHVGKGIVDGRFSIADIAISTMIVNLEHAGFAIDAGRWPKLAGHVAQVHARPSFQSVIAEERAMLGR
jgi:glutathione S-transferase